MIFFVEQDETVDIGGRSKALFVIVCEGGRQVRPIGARWVTVEAALCE
jgi:hypothetical protein